jgi:hypothetical protein
VRIPPGNDVFISMKIICSPSGKVGDYEPGCQLKYKNESKPEPVDQRLGIAEQIDGSGDIKVDQGNQRVGVEGKQDEGDDDPGLAAGFEGCVIAK